MNRILALGLAAAAIGSAALAAPKGGHPTHVELGAPTVYTFTPVKPCPRYETALLVLRSERKLRPLFVTGRGAPVPADSPDGRLTVTFLDPTDIGALLEHAAPGGRMDPAIARGRFAARFTRYSHGEADTERTVCTEWLNRPERPEIVIRVERVTGFKGAEDRHGRPVPDAYETIVEGKLEAAGRSLALKVPARATFVEAEPSKGIRPSLRLDLEFAFQGADFGLTGDDAGEVRASAALVGFTDLVGREAKDLLDHMALPDL